MPSDKRKILGELPEKRTLDQYDRPISIRIPDDVLEAVDTLVERGQNGNKKANRSTVIIALLRDALRLKQSKE